MRSYKKTIERFQREHPNKFSTACLAPQFIPYYESQQRIEVKTTYLSGEVYIRRGTIGMTTGWMPAFLLMPRVTSTGSSDVLTDHDVITKVIK